MLFTTVYEIITISFVILLLCGAAYETTKKHYTLAAILSAFAAIGLFEIACNITNVFILA